MRFALPVFLGSALLFCLEPMLGRTLLPHFGGTASVWTMCLASYQLLLLAGAIYADRLGRVEDRRQYRIHLAMLTAATLWTAVVAASRKWLCGQIPAGRGTATESLAAIVCVVVFIGLPFMIVGAGSSFLQHWAEEAEGRGRETYRLYVVSNVGSLFGLLAYPLLVEPFVPQTWQWAGLAAAIALYAALCAALPRSKRKDGREEIKDESGKWKVESGKWRAESGKWRAESGKWKVESEERRVESGEGEEGRIPDSVKSGRTCYPSSVIHSLTSARARALAWLALPALSTFVLNATTTHIVSDVEPLPLMWAVLLAAFLLSYVIGFSRRGERLLPLWGALTLASCVFAVWALGAEGAQERRFALNLGAGLGLILFGGTFLHAWLCRIRPDGDGITRYYLCIAAGGAAGGLLSAIAPPLVFRTVAEYPIGVSLLAGAALTAPAELWPETIKDIIASFRKGAGLREARIASVICFSIFALAMRMVWIGGNRHVEDGGRSFYGTWRVGRDTLVVGRTGEEIPTRIFMHGGTMHGYEPVDRSLRGPTAYFGPWAGGLAFSLNRKYAAGEPVKCAIIGMGIGVMAWYGREGDEIVFYEIDGQVADAAKRHFSFVPESRASVPVVLGDARKALEKERDDRAPKHDILVVDAYSGDSIPYHLVTRQAFRLYADRLEEGGLLALHVSNWHIDLLPVCKAAAKELGMEALGIFSPRRKFTMDALWVFMSKTGGLEVPEDMPVDVIDWDSIADKELPDDEKGSMLGYVRLFAGRRTGAQSR